MLATANGNATSWTHNVAQLLAASLEPARDGRFACYPGNHSDPLPFLTLRAACGLVIPGPRDAHIHLPGGEETGLGEHGR